MPRPPAGDEAGPPPRKGNRAHKLRRRRKVEDNPMTGGSLRRVYPALVRQARERAAARETTGGETRE